MQYRQHPQGIRRWGDEQEGRDNMDVLKQMTHERRALATAIYDAAIKAGIANRDAPVTGPHLLMLANDMAEQIVRLQASPASIPPDHLDADDLEEAIEALRFVARDYATVGDPLEGRSEWKAADRLQALLDRAARKTSAAPDYLDGVNIPRLMSTLNKMGCTHTEGGKESVAANLADDINRLTSAVEAFQFPAVIPDLTPDLREILGRPNFTCIRIAQRLRELGHTIQTKAEDEQAVVIYWLMSMYLKHGDAWSQLAAAALRPVPAETPPPAADEEVTSTFVVPAHMVQP